MPVVIDTSTGVEPTPTSGRQTFPNAEDRLVYTIEGASDFRPAVARLLRVYSDAGATTLADIQTLAGAAIANSELTVDGNSLLPEFKGPDGVDTLYVKPVGGSTVTRITANNDARLDALNTSLSGIVTGSGFVAHEQQRSIAITAGTTQAGIQEKLNAATPGSRIVFEPNTTFALSTTALVLPVSNLHIDAGRTTFTQSTWGVPVFDALNVHDCVFDIGLAQYIGVRGTHLGSLIRGSAPYTSGCAVWTNGDRHEIRKLRSIGLPTPVYFSSWDGASVSGREGVSNRIGIMECEGYNFGVLWIKQRNLVIDDIYGHDDIDDSSGVNPTHVYYCSAASTARSTGLTVKKARAERNLYGQAFQIKYHDQATLMAHSADQCKGLINIMDCDDLSWHDMKITNSLNTVGQGAVTIQFTTAPSKRSKLVNTSIRTAADVDGRAVAIWADDIDIDGLHVEVNHSASTNTGEHDVILRGNRGRVRGMKIRSVGAAHALGATAGYATNTVDKWLFDKPVVDGCRTVVNILAGSTNVVVDYDAESQTLSGTEVAVSVLGASPTGNEVKILPEKIKTGGKTPAITSSNASTAMSVVGNDTAGRVTFTTASGLAAGVGAVTLTFAQPYIGSTIPKVMLTPANLAAATANGFTVASSATLFAISLQVPPASATVMIFDYAIIQ